MMCSRCGGMNDDPDYKTCASCRAYSSTDEALANHRIRNRRYYWRHRDRFRAEAAERTRIRKERSHEVWTHRWDALRESAKERGRVPTINEIVSDFNIPKPTASLWRKLCFHLKRQKPGGNQPRIPYPVPAEFKTDDISESISPSLSDKDKRWMRAWSAGE